MEPTRFTDDLARIPETLERLAVALDAGLPGLEETARMGAAAFAAGGRSPRVLILGMGSSNYAADIVAREARAAGACVTAELASTRQLPPPADDLIVVAVSATGGSVEVREAVRQYVGHDRLIALTNKPDSPIEHSADVRVDQQAEDELSGIACRSFRHTLITLRAVVASLFPADHPVQAAGAGLPALARAAARANATLLASTAEWIGPMGETLAAPLGTWVLAPVERFSSARQSALMLREIPRRPSFASETGDWSHVDVYLTKTQDYRALIYAGSGWDEQALDWMTERGSRWASVGGDLRGAEVTVRYEGEGDPRVAQLSELLVAEQVAARWLAGAVEA
ncbi:SIS domain-containing protein [Leucobacter sp. W1478]|uniref:SIS domain-containing protein n=1 Tax=Leucobacter sp. W1478 TaxID=3439065 RepID=UPI003F330172